MYKINNQKDLIKTISKHQKVFSTLVNEVNTLDLIINLIYKKLKKGGKIMFCGNGGSAADSQHLAAEFTGRFTKDRKPLNSVALTTDTSALTCIANDYSFDEVFSRQLNAIGNDGDVLICISTSGNSKNIINAVQAAKQKNITSIGFLGKDGGNLKNICDYNIIVPSNTTARIQEAHIFLGHFLCGFVERDLNLVN